MKELTYVAECNVKATNVVELKKFLRGYKNKSEAEFIQINDDGTVTVEWDGKRIISYWYQDFILFLKDLAKYVEGEILLEVESDTQSAIIHFNNGYCYIEIGIMYYKNFTVHEMLELLSSSSTFNCDEIIKNRISIRK